MIPRELNIQLVFQDQIKNFVSACIIMRAIVFDLLVLQKHQFKVKDSEVK